METEQTLISNGSATRRVFLSNVQGLHLRPAMVLSEHAQRYACVIRVSCGDRQEDAKSILGLLTLGAVFGSELVFEAHGPSSTEAVDSLQRLVKRQFRPLEERMPCHGNSHE